jgi:hypothetical protein
MIREKTRNFSFCFTAISVGIIIYQLVYNPTNPIEVIIYLFDLIVTSILITDFYLRMKESKGSRRIFILKHLYEIPALILDLESPITYRKLNEVYIKLINKVK